MSRARFSCQASWVPVFDTDTQKVNWLVIHCCINRFEPLWLLVHKCWTSFLDPVMPLSEKSEFPSFCQVHEQGNTGSIHLKKLIFKHHSANHPFPSVWDEPWDWSSVVSWVRKYRCLGRSLLTLCLGFEYVFCRLVLSCFLFICSQMRPLRGPDLSPEWDS